MQIVKKAEKYYIIYGISFLLLWYSLLKLNIITIIVSWSVFLLLTNLSYLGINGLIVLFFSFLFELKRDIVGDFTIYLTEFIVLSLAVKIIIHFIKERYISILNNLKLLYDYFRKNILDIFWLIFIIIIFISYFKSISISSSIKQTLRYMEIFVIYIYLKLFLEKEKLEKLLMMFLISGSIMCILGIYQYFYSDKNYLNVTGTLWHHNYFASYLLFLFFISIKGIFNKEMLHKVLSIVVLLLTIFNLKFCYSRGAWLSLLFGVTLFMILNKIKCYKIIVTIIILFTFLICVNSDKGSYKLSKNELSLNNIRIRVALEGFKMIKYNPVLGVGVGNYKDAFFKKFSKEVDPSLKPVLEGGLINYYIHLMMETGILGLISFLMLIIVHLLYIIKNIRLVNENDGLILKCILCGIVAFIIQLNFESTIIVHSIGMLFGLFLGMSRLIIEKNKVMVS